MGKKKFIKQFVDILKDTGIIEIIGDPISIQDTNFKVLYQNQSHRAIVGDCVGEYCYKAYQGKDDVCEGCHLDMSFKDGKIHTVERNRTTDEEIRYYENTASSLRDPTGKIIAGIEVVRDITKRKQAEKELQKERDTLEMKVKERTLELEESNTALRVLLKQSEFNKRELEENILSNIKHLILPYIEKLKRNRSMSREIAYLNILESNLKEIISPFSKKLSSHYVKFTTKEIQIAELIKEGKQDKDIVEILNIALTTVKSHRQNIRKKLGIYNKRTNLRSYLLSL